MTLLVHLGLRIRTPLPADPGVAATATSTGIRAYVGGAIVLCAVLLLLRLGSYSGLPVAWEATVVDGFTQAVLQGTGLAAYVSDRLFWDDGLLSAGHTSLFYGAPTYLLTNTLGFSLWTLRIASAVASLLAVVLMFVIGRRFFDPVTGAIAAVVFALNPAVLYYGRYASSPAGTLLAVLLAVVLIWRLLDEDRPSWWVGPAAAVALFAATLQYAPGRLVVLLLLGFVAVTGLWRIRRLHVPQVVGIVAVAAIAGGVWMFESSSGRQHAFLNARGEHFFALLHNPRSMNDMFGAGIMSEDVDVRHMTTLDKAKLIPSVLQVTVPQYLRLVAPRLDAPTEGGVFLSDPPPLPLYVPATVAFLLLGLATSVARRSWKDLWLLVWVAGCTVPLLLTSRVDSHRTMLFVVPFSLWTALGVRELVAVIGPSARCRVPAHGLALVSILCLFFYGLTLLHHRPGQELQPRGGTTMRAEIAAIQGPVGVGWLGDQREIAWMQMDVLNRMHRQPEWQIEFLPPRLLHGLQGGAAGLASYARELRDIAGKRTVLLAPASSYRTAVAAVQMAGIRVAEKGVDQFRVLRLDAGAAATGVSDEELDPLPTLIIPPTPTPIALVDGPGVWLDELAAVAVDSGFAPPQTNRSWNGSPISMRGVQYPRGFGMHAPCRMTFAVPAPAVALQAIVGLSDSIGECTNASVVFQVLGQDGRVLFESPLVSSNTGPIPIRAPVAGEDRVSIVATDAGDGIDCDHANWAMARFLFDH